MAIIRADAETAVALHREGRFSEALPVLERLESSIPGDSPMARKVAFLRINCLFELQRTAELQVAVDAFIERYGDSEDPVVLVAVANALWRRAMSLQRDGADDAARDALNDLLRRFADEPREVVAGAMYNLGILLEKAGDGQRALELWQQVYERFGSDEPDQGLVAALGGLGARARYLDQHGMPVEAVAAARVFGERAASVPGAVAWTAIAGTALDTGWLLTSRGEHDQALALFRVLITRLQQEHTPAADCATVNAQIGIGVTLARLSRFEDALDANAQILSMGEPAMAELDRVSDRFKQIGTTSARERLVWAQLMRVGVLETLMRPEQAQQA